MAERPHAPPDAVPDDLVDRAQAGDANAFEQLYRMHVGRVYAICIRMVADPVRAGILTQDAFVHAWRQLATFHGTAAFSSWLHRLTVNVVLGELRTQQRRAGRVDSLDDLADSDPPSRDRQTDAKMDLEQGIATLPPQARAVLVLHDIEGYRHEEIGEMMGIATGTSKAHLHRARQLLRAMLDSTR
ncbi:MAG: sigma-70 family RNA polymerase sigma factor [Rhodothermales bacterium]